MCIVALASPTIRVKQHDSLAGLMPVDSNVCSKEYGGPIGTYKEYRISTDAIRSTAGHSTLEQRGVHPLCVIAIDSGDNGHG